MVVFKNLVDFSQDRRWDSGCGLINGIHQDPLMFARFPTLASSRASAPLYPFTNNPATTGHTLETQESIEATVRSFLSSVSLLEFHERRLRYNQCQATCVALTVNHTPPHSQSSPNS